MHIRILKLISQLLLGSSRSNYLFLGPKTGTSFIISPTLLPVKTTSDSVNYWCQHSARTGLVITRMLMCERVLLEAVMFAQK